MLLKYSNGPFVGKGGKGKGKFIRVNGGHKVNNSIASINRIYQRRQYYSRLPGKRPNLGKILPRISPPAPSDSSNDSGLGTDGINHYATHQHQNQQQQQQNHQQQQIFQEFGFGSIISTATVAPTIVQPPPNFFFFNHHRLENDVTLSDRHRIIDEKDEHRRPKRPRIASIALESEDACSDETFMMSQRTAGSSTEQQQSPINYSAKRLSEPGSSKYTSMSKRLQQGQVVASTSQFTGAASHSPPEGSVSRDGKVHLQILSQPEQQHRARYQTEGSRGAIKDRKGSGFPLVKLVGYNKPAKLQVYIGTDVGRAVPHMFYQACKVSSKNSTPCSETKIDGTVVIEVDLSPETDMTVTCDCIGILKERNVDVELRFPDQQTPKSKKKSTRCRMVFKTEIINDDGEKESLFICSQPIVCTQPPGVPEICRKSLSECSCLGGQDLFIIGKNFAKDTRVIFKAVKKGTYNTIWEETVIPEQEFLQQTHLICTVPPYLDTTIVYPVNVHLFIISNGKKSDSQNFLYTPQASSINTLSQMSLTAITGGPKAIQQAHGKPAPRDDVAIFVSSEGFETDESSDTKMNVMLPPAAPSAGVSLMSLDLQTEPSDLQALAAVKAELLEETSQSSLMSTTSGTESLQAHSSSDTLAFSSQSNSSSAIKQEEKMEIGSEMMLPGDMIEMQIKQEIARRGSMTQSNPTTPEYSQILSPILPQVVPTLPSDAQKSQLLMEHYQANLVAATTTQLSLHGTRDVLMSHDPASLRSSENIMNTNIAPTLMVPAVHGGLESVNPILSSPVLAGVDSAALLAASTATPMEQDSSPPARTSPVAVKTMILNAAAEILSSPENPPSAETRSTINALMAFNSELSAVTETPSNTTPTNPTETNPSNTLTGSHLLENEIR
ncbi:nuclear factor of activated T-cells 5 isoform X2 [Culicoides brevitarsis]